jgi:hypothetical protein
MAMPNEVRGVWVAATYSVRAFVCLLGLGAIAWGGFLLPFFWRAAAFNSVAHELLQGHPFKSQTLVDEARQIEATEQSLFCDPTELHNAVILHLAIANEAIATKDRKRIEAAVSPLYASTRKALSCEPADSFAWLMLFWVDVANHGFHADDANYLRLSYALGPNEGWIALWRSQLAIAVFERLPNDLSNDAVDEFIKLIDTGSLYPQTAAIFASATPTAQSRLAVKLKSVSLVARQILARALYDKGLDIHLPGVDGPARPWQ